VLNMILLTALQGAGLGRNLYVNNGKDAQEACTPACNLGSYQLCMFTNSDTSLDLADHGTFRTHAAGEPALQQTHATNRLYVQLLCFGATDVSS
jgi:hypothetical protein